MDQEPRHRDDYRHRQTEAARRVLVDVGQILASFSDCLVLVGGWIPDLLLPEADEPHVGSIDVDLALDARKLKEGRYAELLSLLLNTRRYQMGTKEFQLVVDVDLKDGEKPVQVEVEFLAPKSVKLQKNKPKLLKDFRVLQADGCEAAFRNPHQLKLQGRNVGGAQNTVRLQVASLADFLVMKAHALAGRDKPKDTYDFCYCLQYSPGGLESLAEEWKTRQNEPEVAQAIEILSEKFSAPDAFGPHQLAEFHSPSDEETQAMNARRAYEWVQEFLRRIRE
ncbi:MAG: hypothetical protein BGO12_17225 [Verrucomicrobia bacterium 61-8]|nr:nucleotidyl transferase AbiEii/AbiGii toxin family protein [Verrucomicrobiota bacterium]OJV12067.1 MAG: hypothetical protein BGO12_17225 [Verrucomicrobia bacterium 61-8]